MEAAEPGKLAVFFHNGQASETCIEPGRCLCAIGLVTADSAVYPPANESHSRRAGAGKFMSRGMTATAALVP